VVFILGFEYSKVREHISKTMKSCDQKPFKQSPLASIHRGLILKSLKLLFRCPLKLLSQPLTEDRRLAASAWGRICRCLKMVQAPSISLPQFWSIMTALMVPNSTLLDNYYRCSIFSKRLLHSRCPNIRLRSLHASYPSSHLP
jgi:hypothetical protein